MAFYYVKSGGTATGDAGRAASARTGSFATMGASAYYASMVDIIGGGAVPTTAAAAGDTICVSDLHSHDTIASTSYVFPDKLKALSVDDANAENLKAGASEGSSSTGSDTINLDNSAAETLVSHGIFWRADSVFNVGSIDGMSVLELGELKTTHTTKGVTFGEIGQVTILRDVRFKPSATGTGIEINDGATIELRGGSIDTGGPVPTSIFQTQSRGAHYYVRCFDASYAGGLYDLDDNTDGPSYDLARLKVGSGAQLSEQHTADIGPRFDLWGYGETTGGPDDYWAFHSRYFNFGTTDHDTSIYRDGGANVDGKQKLTALMSATDQVIPFHAPLRFKLAELLLDLTASVTITVELAQWDDTAGAPTRLKQDEFWLEIERPDATDLGLGVIDTTRPATYDISATQSDLTTSTVVWKKGSDDSTITADITKSKAAHTLPTITGADKSHVTVWACLAKDLSAVGDVNVDLEVDET